MTFIYGFIHLTEKQAHECGVRFLLVIMEKEKFNPDQLLPETLDPAVYREIMDVVGKHGIEFNNRLVFLHLLCSADEIKARLEAEPKFTHSPELEAYFEKDVSTKLPVNLDSTDVFDDDCGDKFTLDEFLEICDSGGIMDDDGFAEEIILNGKVISNKVFDPSDLDEGVRHQLTALQKEHGTFHVVWYNK